MQLYSLIAALAILAFMVACKTPKPKNTPETTTQSEPTVTETKQPTVPTGKGMANALIGTWKVVKIEGIDVHKTEADLQGMTMTFGEDSALRTNWGNGIAATIVKYYVKDGNLFTLSNNTEQKITIARMENEEMLLRAPDEKGNMVYTKLKKIQ